jgi:hypothetical protein
VREIAGFLLDHYKVEVSADFISTVTESGLHRKMRDAKVQEMKEKRKRRR